MKKYFYLLVLALMPICFVGCGSDDDNDDATGVAGIETLYGTWQQTHGVALKMVHFITTTTLVARRPNIYVLPQMVLVT